MCWLSVLSSLFIKCVHYIFTYNTINPSIFAGSYCRAYHLTWFSTLTEYTQMHWPELPSAFKIWFDILTCLTKYFHSSAHICGIIYMSPHTMFTQLKTFHSKVVHNCYRYTDYTHCPCIHVYIIMYTCKIIMYTCILNYVYMQGIYVYMQGNYVYIIPWYFFHTSQNLCSALKKLWSDVPSGPPYLSKSSNKVIFVKYLVRK